MVRVSGIPTKVKADILRKSNENKDVIRHHFKLYQVTCAYKLLDDGQIGLDYKSEIGSIVAGVFHVKPMHSLIHTDSGSICYSDKKPDIYSL